ncbi:TRAP transporter small permease [Pararhodobacter zhoushanensis]|uniref:TRAP transporter small permease n=1 Tax=Pararhodobacter zhoushanensis TaxID=2479545 RepID=UPI000F8D8214|nr:TRAP transporter small permease [Pararhodobacter zhoushanensis]
MDRFLRAIELAASLMLGVVTLITFANVVMRFGFNSALMDSFDLTRMAQGLALAWGIAVTTHRSEHITIDGLWTLMGPRGRRVMDIVARVITGGFLLVLTLAMAQRAYRNMLSNLSTAELSIPIWGFHAAMTLGIALACFVVFASIRLVRNGGYTRGAA